jgi:magnesium chelatase family protein
MSLTLPTFFVLSAAMDLSPCGFWNDQMLECRCTPTKIPRYVCPISGPLLDCIDIHIDLPAVCFKDLSGEPLPIRKAQGKSARELSPHANANTIG